MNQWGSMVKSGTGSSTPAQNRIARTFTLTRWETASIFDLYVVSRANPE